MAIDVQAPDEAEQAAQGSEDQVSASSSAKGSGSLVRRVIASRWTLAAVAAWAVIQTAGLAAYYALGRSTPEAAREVTIGQFRFEAPPVPDAVYQADFTIHVVAAPSLEKFVGQQLAEKQLRVRQAIEELLRLAGPTDFEDPVLGELKRRIKAKLNQLLGAQAIADVLVTDLKLQRAASGGAPTGSDCSDGVAGGLPAEQESSEADRPASTASSPSQEKSS